MRYYVEITLLPSPEFGLYLLWEELYKVVHLRLVTVKNNNKQAMIGVSFPEYQTNWMGRKLRLFAPEERLLTEFDAAGHLARLSDHVHVKGIRPVSEGVTRFACFQREQPKSNRERLARRKASREGTSMEEALHALKGFREERVKTPFVRIKSRSSDQRFPLFILKKEANTLRNDEGFSSYGLSSVSSVPDF